MSKTTINNTKGIAWALVSVLSAGSMTVGVRAASEALSSTTIVLYRFGIATAILMTMIALLPKYRAKLSFKRKGAHILRGVLIAFATHFGFYAITAIPVNTAAVLFFTAPIFAVVLSVVVQGETIGPRRIVAIAMGFVGAVIVCQPGVGAAATETSLWGYAAALCASVLFALALIMSRGLAEVDGVFSTVVSAGVITTLISIPISWPTLQWSTSAWIIGVVIFLSIAGLIRNVADIEQYHWGEAAIVGPFSYLRLIVVALGAYWLFRELPDMPTLIGGAIIIASTFYIALRERMMGGSARPPSGP
ncbi:MAG: DMT family transporter [Pseudomonadota bacterium]